MKLYDTPIKAIRKKCLDCTCGQVLEIRKCTVISCALYPYRMGRRPDASTIEALEDLSDEKSWVYWGFLPRKSIPDSHMKDNILPRNGFYYKNELWYSNAYQKLRPAARELLHCFICELRWSWTGSGKNKSRQYTNNGELSFTEVQFKERYGSCSATYLSARNQLIECGFIKQTYRGGYGRGDMARYKILCVEGVMLDHQRWRKYPQKNWVHEIPKPKKQLVGVKTQFKKGRTGRKVKATLIN